MMDIKRLKDQHPEYDDMTLEDFAYRVWKKNYSDMPFEQFSEKANIAAHMAAEDVGPLEAGLIGAGEAFTSLGRGAKELYQRVIGDEEGRESTRKQAEQEQKAYSALQQQQPVATALGESAPYIAGGLGIGGAMRGAGLARNLMAQGAGGGLLGFTEYAPTMGERGVNAITEAGLSAAGEGIGRAISRIAHPAVQRAGQAAKDIVDRGQKIGYTALPSAEYDSRLLRQTVEGGLEATPGGSFVMDAVRGQNQRLFNTHVAEAIGEQADAVTGDVLNQAATRIGDVFDDVLNRKLAVRFNKADKAAVEAMQDDLTTYLASPIGPLDATVERALNLVQGGATTGRELHKLQSQLGAKARSAARSPTVPFEVAHKLFDLQHLLLKAAERSAGKTQADKLRTARNQWRNLANIESSRAVNPVTGDVSAPKLAGGLELRDKQGFLRGKNRSKMYEGARFMGRFQRDLPTSGTAERSYLGDALKMGALGAVGGGTLGQDLQHGATVGIGAGLVAPHLLARGYLSPMMRNWLTSSSSYAFEQQMRALGLGGVRGMYGE